MADDGGPQTSQFAAVNLTSQRSGVIAKANPDCDEKIAVAWKNLDCLVAG